MRSREHDIGASFGGVPGEIRLDLPRGAHPYTPAKLTLSAVGSYRHVTGNEGKPFTAFQLNEKERDRVFNVLKDGGIELSSIRSPAVYRLGGKVVMTRPGNGWDMPQDVLIGPPDELVALCNKLGLTNDGK